MVIWKYPLKVEDTQTLTIPTNGKILSIQTQDRVPCMWVLLDERDCCLLNKRTFHIHGTGNSLPSSINEDVFIGTFQLGYFVGHVFEVM